MGSISAKLDVWQICGNKYQLIGILDFESSKFKYVAVFVVFSRLIGKCRIFFSQWPRTESQFRSAFQQDLTLDVNLKITAMNILPDLTRDLKNEQYILLYKASEISLR